MLTTTQTQPTATECLRNAIRHFEPKGDGKRLAFKDRMIELTHEWMRSPMAIDDLVSHADAIDKKIDPRCGDAYFAEMNAHMSFVSALVAMACDMGATDRQELLAIAQERIAEGGKTDARFCYWKALRNELSR